MKPPRVGWTRQGPRCLHEASFPALWRQKSVTVMKTAKALSKQRMPTPPGMVFYMILSQFSPAIYLGILPTEINRIMRGALRNQWLA